MTDVFLSYASDDRERARLLAGALEARGWSVWWDRKIVAGETFDHVIERQLEAARSVVVLWSNNSISSDWVKNEAAAASERRILVPAILDDVKPPLAFRQIQTADLVGWNGGPSHSGFQAVCDGIAAKMNNPGAAPQKTSGAAKRRSSLNPRHISAAIAAVVVLAVLVIAFRPGNLTRLRGLAGGDGRRGQNVAQVETIAAERRGIDNPLPIEFGVTYRIDLDKDNETYFKLPSEAAELKVVLDTQRIDKRSSNLQSELTVLDRERVVLERAIRVNEIGVRHRKTTTLSLMAPTMSAFKLLNENQEATFWLNVMDPAPTALIPFFGEIVPVPFGLGEDASGQLARWADAYYMASLPQGEYKAVVDFSSFRGENTNIMGYFAILDPDGGNERTIVRFNEIDISQRKVGTFSLKSAQRLITRVHNSGTGVRYKVNLTRNQ